MKTKPKSEICCEGLRRILSAPQPQLGPEPRRCRVCGCTDDECSYCIALTGEPCSWVDEDLCSACAPLSSSTDRRLRAEDCIAAAMLMLDRAKAQIPSDNKRFKAMETALTLSRNAVEVALNWVWRGGK